MSVEKKFKVKNETMPESGPSQQTTAMSTQIIQASSIAEFNINENWQLWHERLELHLLEINCTSENGKVSTMLKTIGADAYAILHSLCSPTLPSKKSYEELTEIMKQHFTPPVIVFHERRNFYHAKMAENETISSWFARVKKLSLNCKFESTELDRIVMDKFIVELSTKIFEKLCEEDEKLTLSNALKKAILRESKIINGTPSEVNFVRQQQQSKGHRSSSSNNNKKGKKTACSHCGWTNHASDSCKFKSSRCNACGKLGHLANICRNKSNKVDKSDKSVHFVKSSLDVEQISNEFSNNFSVFHIDKSQTFGFDYSIFAVYNQTTRDYYELAISINAVKLTVLCDTGAPCSLMSIREFDRYFDRVILRACGDPFTGYGGEPLKIVGQFQASVIYDGIELIGRFIVTKTDRPTLLGRNFLRGFGFELVQNRNKIANDSLSVGFVNSQSHKEIIEQIKAEFSDVFKSGLGKYNISTVSLPIVKDAIPVFCKPRPIPIAWRDALSKHIDELVKSGVLIQVDSSDWGTPLVPILKPSGDLRVCGDYKVTINKFLVDFKYPLPLIDQIYASMQGGQLFSKLDLSNAYNQLVLDNESQKLCTWSTHKGMFRMTRLPFGVKTAAAIFQKTLEGLLSQFDNVFCYQDDIVVTGKNFSEHLKTLKQVLLKLQAAGLRLNVTKCEFFKDKISYLGFDIDKNGISKNKDRIKSVLNAPRPSNISELRAFIGMANCYSKFIADFAQKLTPLYTLLQKDVPFVWSNSCDETFKTIKADICSDNVLVHFNPKLPIILSTDASGAAISGVLSHKYDDTSIKPIAYVSRALNKAELNYSTIEKEALAIIFSVVKLRQYLLGNFFTLLTDHKPLLTIFGEHKGIPAMAAARMQRWAFLLSGFNYTIQYVKGSLNIADSLSRIAQQETTQIETECSYINYIGFVNTLQLSYKDIAIHTRRDPVLSKLLEHIQNGTVEQLKDIEFSAFRSKSLELTVECGCILWGYRTVIPTKLREAVLQDLHTSHLGVVKTKALARSYVYWPNLDRDIENLIKKCEPCQLSQASPEKSLLIPWTPTVSA